MTFLTFGKDIFGGIENSIYSLAQGLIGTSNEIIIYTGGLNKGAQTIDGIKIYYSSYLKDVFNEPIEDIDLNILKNYKENKLQIETELELILKIENPDYILSIDGLWGIISFLDIFEKIKCPSGIVYHMAYNQDLINVSSNRPFDHFFFVSEYLYKKIDNMIGGFDKEKVYILPNSVQTERFRLKEEKEKIKSDIIFCNSRLGPEKGIEYLIEAFIKVSKICSQALLVLCGGDFHFGSNIEIIENVRSLSRKHDIEERIIILPALPWSAVPRYLNDASVVVLPTRDETFGIAALESLASGTPLIASSVGNLPDLIKDAGILVKDGNVDGFAESIIKVLSDSDLRERMIKKGFEIAGSYDCEVVAGNLLRIIGGSDEK